MTPDVAIVLAGGVGSRLRSTLPDVPKVLAPIAGRPFLDHLFRYLEREGIATIVLATGFAADRVEAAAQAHRGHLRIECSREAEPHGTGGAIAQALQRVNGSRAWVFNGDSFCAAPLAQIAEAAAQSPDDAWLVAVEVADTSRFGTIAFDDPRSIRFEEKRGLAQPGWINAGIYLLPRSLADSSTMQAPWSIERELFPRLAEAGRLRVFPWRAPFIDIGTPESYAAAERFFESLA